MSEHDAIAAAFDRAIAAVDRAAARKMRGRDGELAEAQLERLRARLAAERTASLQRGSVDPAWVGPVIRWVVEWAPESDLSLLAALGGIARVRRG